MAALGGLAFAASVQGDQRPNFVVILTDDQGWGTTSSVYDPAHPESQSDFFETPCLDRLIERGVRFTQAYAAHPNCSPSRASLLTGRSPAALHFTDICGRSSGNLYEGNRLIPPQHIDDLPHRETTIPELLKRIDPEYRAAHFGKWHLRGGGPLEHGFDSCDGTSGNGAGGRAANLPDDPKRCFSITRNAIDWMQLQVDNDAPFYLQVSHFATHLPYQARPETLARFRDKPPGDRHQNVRFAAMIADMDESIGSLLDAIDDLEISDNTFIFYTADNGTYPTDDSSNINGPLRGSKATVWEAGIRVPFVVAGPGISHGEIRRTPVVGYDILPTICELAGRANAPELVEGGSLVPALFDDGIVARPRNFLVFHWPHYQHEKNSKPDSVILCGQYKLHYWWEEQQVMLFDLEADLAEQHDLAPQFPEIAERLRNNLLGYLDDVDALLPTQNDDYSPETDPARKTQQARR